MDPFNPLTPLNPFTAPAAATTAFLPLVFWWAFFVSLTIVGLVDYGIDVLVSWSQRHPKNPWTQARRLRYVRPYVRVVIRWRVSVRTGMR